MQRALFGATFMALLAQAQAQSDSLRRLNIEETLNDMTTLYIVLAIIVDIILLLLCLCCRNFGDGEVNVKWGKPKVPEGQDPKEFALNELQMAFEEKNAPRYAGALELAREVGVQEANIPMVFSIHKQMETFKAPVGKGPSVVTAQLCFILDYTGSMKEQINQAEKSCRSIVDAVKSMNFPHMPDAKVELEMGAVCYNDWDDKTASLGRPVVSAFKGKELFKRHDPNLSINEFNLGGSFTKDTDEIMQWIKQPLGNGGSIPEEMTGGLLAATHLPWSAEQRLAVIITDAPCHGKDYSGDSHDPFCDKTTGLTCSGRPEVPLMTLKSKNVQVVILHTGSSGAVKMCEKLMRTAPDLIHQKVSPSETAAKLVEVMDAKLQLQPLTYMMKPFVEQDTKHVAKEHTAAMTLGYNTSSHVVDSSGLFWVGIAGSVTPKIKVTRPGDSSLDKWWSNETEEVEIGRRFDPNMSYILKMPRKK